MFQLWRLISSILCSPTLHAMLSSESGANVVRSKLLCIKISGWRAKSDLQFWQSIPLSARALSESEDGLGVAWERDSRTTASDNTQAAVMTCLVHVVKGVTVICA